MLQRKIRSIHQTQGFTILEVIVAVGISSIVMIAGFHFISLQSNSVAKLQERAKVRSISQDISRAVQSGYTLGASAEKNKALNSCLYPETNELCQAYRTTSFVLQSRGNSFVYAGESQGDTRFYDLPPLACKSRQTPLKDKQKCRLQAISTFKARCPLGESGNKVTECPQAADIIVSFELIRESDGKRLYKGRSTYPVLSKNSLELQTDTSCPANSVKITRKRNDLNSHSECECKPGFKKTNLPFGGIACRATDSTACPQGDQGSIYHGFQIDNKTREVIPQCSNVFCKTLISKRYDLNQATRAAENLQANANTIDVQCPEGSWMSAIWIDNCEAGVCFFKKEGSRCYRDPDKTVLGSVVSCNMKYRCCAKDPMGIQALKEI